MAKLLALMRMKRLQRILQNEREHQAQREVGSPKTEKDKRKERRDQAKSRNHESNRERNPHRAAEKRDWAKQAGRNKGLDPQARALEMQKRKSEARSRAGDLRTRVKHSREIGLDLWDKMR